VAKPSTGSGSATLYDLLAEAAPSSVHRQTSLTATKETLDNDREEADPMFPG